MTIALTGARIFDGSHMLDGRAVVIENGRVRGVPEEKDLGTGIERRAVQGLLAPGFIDVQVNGGGGVLYNDLRSVEGIRTIAQAHRAYGTTGLLPTLITDTRETMAEAVEAMRAALDAGIPGVLGIHLTARGVAAQERSVQRIYREAR